MTLYTHTDEDGGIIVAANNEIDATDMIREILDFENKGDEPVNIVNEAPIGEGHVLTINYTDEDDPQFN